MYHVVPAFLQGLRRLHQDEEAATTTEYAVMLSMMLVVMLGALQFYGESLNALFGSISETLFAA
jgi:Flp pilus assembly pilin Flp